MSKNIPVIPIGGYHYELPSERIAKFPLESRDMSKLLVYDRGAITENTFKSISEYIPSQAALVFNNSKVIYARLLFRKQSGAQIEIFCLEPVLPFEHQLSLQSMETVTWKCLVRNKKKWKTGLLEKRIMLKGREILFRAEMVVDDDEPQIKFNWYGNVTFGELLESTGKIPIPPYLLREAEESDHERYQTVYSAVQGSVAAPTAGLHFTPDVITQIKKKGVQTKEFTLHVGAGTFKPVQSENVADHYMHEETFEITIEQIRFLKKYQAHIYAVGTTSTRLLESIYYIGLNCIENKKNDLFKVNQWDPYDRNVSYQMDDSLDALMTYFNKHKLTKVLAQTSIIIVPGYKFKVVKGLITNFHQPKSTLLLLIAAFIGDDWKKLYDYALSHDFRFLSYGDSSLLIP